MGIGLQIKYVLFRTRKKLWDKMKQFGLIHKRPIFDAGGVYIKRFMVPKY